MTDKDTPTAGSRLSIHLSHHRGVRVVTACGEIDFDGAPQLLDALTAHDAAAHATVLDLSDVTFMDSSGVNALIAAHHAAQHHGGQLRLAAPGPHVSEIFGIVGLAEVIPCHSTLRDALDV
ncbi:STAS domain-containing protein [Streptomyces sp. NPDC006655]|uniref:STAS domain-containing protein n=1 Tax=Streptomyces sp. NPDC006655 TaxID=3156898 RepID=UPI0034524504